MALKKWGGRSYLDNLSLCEKAEREERPLMCRYEERNFNSAARLPATFDPLNVRFHAVLQEEQKQPRWKRLLSADSTNDHIHRKFTQPAVFPQHQLSSVRMRLIGFKSTFPSGETLSLSFPLTSVPRPR